MFFSFHRKSLSFKKFADLENPISFFIKAQHISRFFRLCLSKKWAQDFLYVPGNPGQNNGLETSVFTL